MRKFCWLLSIFAYAIQQVYIYLSKLLRHCILTKSQSQTVIVQGPVGDPPFEVPDIQKIVSNFVFLKVSFVGFWGLNVLNGKFVYVLKFFWLFKI